MIALLITGYIVIGLAIALAVSYCVFEAHLLRDPDAMDVIGLGTIIFGITTMWPVFVMMVALATGLFFLGRGVSGLIHALVESQQESK